MAEALGTAGEGVIITQVVPHLDTDLPGVAEYRQALKAYAPQAKPSFVSLEGYLVARIFVEGVKVAGHAPSRERIIDAIESLTDLDIGIGVNISYSRTRRQGSHNVWITMIKEGRVVAIDWVD